MLKKQRPKQDVKPHPPSNFPRTTLLSGAEKSYAPTEQWPPLTTSVDGKTSENLHLNAITDDADRDEPADMNLYGGIERHSVGEAGT